MDEISQDPKLSFGFPRRRWPDVAVAAALIAAAALTVMTSQRSQPAAPAAAPALPPSTVTTQIPLPSGQPGRMTIPGSTARASDWSASQIAAVDLAARRVTRTRQAGDPQENRSA